MATPLVSILVTVYNRDRFLTNCLSSILASRFHDFEVIIVDDCSTDNSAKIARQFASLDSRVHVFQNAENLGQFANRNRAAEHANGSLIKYLDSDDLIYPDSLGIMVEAIRSCQGAAISLSYPIPDPDNPFPFVLSPKECYYQEFLGRGCLSVGPSASIIDREAFLKIGGFRNVGVASDLDLWYRLSARHHTVFHQPGLVWWRKHQAQAFRAATASQDYLVGGNVIRIEALTAGSCPLSPNDQKRALERAKQHFARRILKHVSQNRRLSEALSLWKKSGLTFWELLKGFSKYR